jgi:transposase
VGASTRRRGAKKTGGQASQALGRARGGFSTTLHAGCLDEKLSVARELTSGARHDAPVFEVIFAQGPALPQLEYAVMDKGSDSDQIRQHLQAQEVTPVIPPRQNRNQAIRYATEPYRLRGKVERFFNKMKHFPRVATRYEQLRQTFLAIIYVVALWVMSK